MPSSHRAAFPRKCLSDICSESSCFIAMWYHLTSSHHISILLEDIAECANGLRVMRCKHFMGLQRHVSRARGLLVSSKRIGWLPPWCPNLSLKVEPPKACPSS